MVEVAHELMTQGRNDVLFVVAGNIDLTANLPGKLGIIGRKRGDLSEKDGLAVIKSQVKQRKESYKIFEKANRSELAEKEKNEMAILGSYLPQMMSDDDIRSLVSSIIEDTGADSISDIGKVMPVILARGGGRVDGKTANVIVRELLE